MVDYTQDKDGAVRLPQAADGTVKHGQQPATRKTTRRAGSK